MEFVTKLFDRWMSEKLDGWRAYWDGGRLLSRQGYVITCPKWFTSTLPNHITLDGELWMGQGTTHVNVTTVLNSKNGDWSQMRYYVFDIPSSPGTYEDRMKEMVSLKSVLSPHVHIVENTRCTGTEHLLS